MAVFPLAPVGALCELIGGGTPTSTNSDYWADEGATPWVSVADMSTTDRVHSTKKTVTDAGIESARLKVGEPDTVLFAMYASVGKYSVLGIKATWNQAILGLKPKSEQQLFWKYLFYSLETIQPILPTLYRSTTQNNLNAEQVSQIRIPLPDLDTQRRIADYLDKETAQIDTLVEELDGYVELLEKRNTQLVDHYISGEPVSLNLLSTYFDCVHTTPEPDEYGEFESVRTSSIRSGKFVQGQGITVSEETYKTRNRDISPEAGDLFFTREAPAGESCLVPESNTYCAGQRVVTIRPNREKILPSYLLWALNSSIAQDFFRLRSTGSTVGNIKMDTIGQVKIPVPEISEQRKIVKEIEKHLGRTDALIKECRELKEILLKRRQVLITDVVTGKVEV